ncbi:PREDICTED: uncharacterized protein LOC108366833 [Rhagoletis zephyria]|uniref:uncharacterized protein LOC108366833 n=1 Tax=Rhagoletis zephyria TaxID=28612 RepID=UPI000811717D|nr:PREDICTED: uncharacterized protein LOC108366833 [Rhagoletis zephyria]
MVILRPLPDDLAKKASEELNEKCDDNDYYVNTLREWAEKQPFLRARTDDQFLMAFLRGSKFSLEKAKQKLENFYILRAAMPEMFRNRNLSEPKYEAIIKSGIIEENFYVHGNNLEELYKYVPKHVLPKEYGGDCDLQTLQAEWWQKLNDYKKFFEEEEEQYGIAEGYERLKQVKDLIADTSVLQGTEGSFRQLEVD